MHTPAVALAWELWRRHRLRLIAVIGLVLGFALIYPIVCASVGFNPAGQDPLDGIVKIIGLQQRQGGPTAIAVFEIFFFIFLLSGPWLAMILSLLFVAWIFTFVELDPKTRALTFPGRLFTLPISTSFLSWSLMLSGIASIIVLHGCWTYFVRLPHVEVFETYRSCLGWVTMLALAQGIVWALDGWPNARMMLVVAVLFCFLFAPAQHQIFQSPWVLPPLLVLGIALARIGLQKMRHGQWQGWAAPMVLVARRTEAEKRSPGRFASPAQAQLWFEWRRFSRPMCLYAAGLIFAPVAILLCMRVVFGRPLQQHDLAAFVCYLIGVPIFVHFIFGISPFKTDLSFLMNRPLTSGEFMMQRLKVSAISAVVSWGFVLAALCIMPLIGNFFGVVRSASVPLMGWGVIATGLIFLTWRFIPVSLGFVSSGNRRIAEIPSWIFLAVSLGGIFQTVLMHDEAVWNSLCRLLPYLLTGLVALKLLLAVVTFHLSLKRRLLSRSALAGYLLVWFLIVAVLLALLEVMASIRPLERGAFFPLAMGIVLLVPLARIGFCPIALSWNRHS